MAGGTPAPRRLLKMRGLRGRGRRDAGPTEVVEDAGAERERPAGRRPHGGRFGDGRSGVYLGALEAAAVIHVDGLPLGEELEGAESGLAVAVAGAAGAAEGELDLG